MCGLLGIFGLGEKIKPPPHLLGHRGPDAFGVFEDEVILLAHNRLAIIDLDTRAVQPMNSALGNYKIIFNGEIYNFKSLKVELEKKGIVFKTESDTEVIINGFEMEGEDWFKRLEGMFALAIYDINDKSLVKVSDQLVQEPTLSPDASKIAYGFENNREKVGATYHISSCNTSCNVMKVPKIVPREVQKVPMELPGAS